MSTTTAIARPQAKDPRAVKLEALFTTRQEELLALLPRHFDLKRFKRLVFTQILARPDLIRCTIASWWAALQKSASMGLYPDATTGHGYLIPSQNTVKTKKQNGQGGTYTVDEKVWEVRFQPGYLGLIDLARRSGEVLNLWAEVVYKKDTFHYQLGLERDVKHVPYEGDDDPGPLVATYAVAKLVGGEITFVVLLKRDILRIMQSAQNAANTTSPWQKHTAAMWKKSSVVQLAKWIPKSSEKMDALRAVALEEERADLGTLDVPIGGEEANDLDALGDGSETSALDEIVRDEAEKRQAEPVEPMSAAAPQKERVVGEDDDEGRDPAAEAVAGDGGPAVPAELARFAQTTAATLPPVAPVPAAGKKREIK